MSAKPPARAGSWILLAILFLVFSLGAYRLVLNRAMTSGYNRDENQFIAAASLLADDGLLPYVDYPFFHTPNLVFAYAVLFKLTVYKLLIARYLSVICATAAIGSLFWITFYLFRKRSWTTRCIMSFSAAILLLADPLFTMASGKAWNHDTSVLMALLAAIAMVLGSRERMDRKWLAAAGVCLGLAIGFRSVWAITTPAFLLAIFSGRTAAARWEALVDAAWFGLAGALAMSPTLILFLAAPLRFWFGNVTYARLNTQFRQATGFDEAMTLGAKLDYFLEYPEAGFWLLLVATVFFVFLLPAIGYFRLRRASELSIFLPTLIALAFIGALLATPSFRQYFYALVPFSILGIMIRTAQITEEQQTGDHTGWGIGLVLLIAFFSGIRGLQDYRAIWETDPVEEWFPLHVHWTAEKIAARVDPGRILTFSPIFAVEAGRDIYPEFATGPFAWRTADLLAEGQRIGFGMVGPDELDDLLRETPPDGFLVGWEPEYEAEILGWLADSGYEASGVSTRLELWLP